MLQISISCYGRMSTTLSEKKKVTTWHTEHNIIYIRLYIIGTDTSKQNYFQNDALI